MLCSLKFADWNREKKLSQPTLPAIFVQQQKYGVKSSDEQRYLRQPKL